jgi:hypothetical protein
MNCAAAEDEQNEKPIIHCPVHVNAVAACRLRPAAVCHPGAGRNALAEAISQQNEAALSEVLGDNWQHFYPPTGSTPLPSTAFSATGR